MIQVISEGLAMGKIGKIVKGMRHSPDRLAVSAPSLLCPAMFQRPIKELLAVQRKEALVYQTGSSMQFWPCSKKTVNYLCIA